MLGAKNQTTTLCKQQQLLFCNIQVRRITDPLCISLKIVSNKNFEESSKLMLPNVIKTMVSTVVYMQFLSKKIMYTRVEGISQLLRFAILQKTKTKKGYNSARKL